jgi:hypothetical protein
MHRLRDAVHGIKARANCRNLARQLGLSRRRIPFPRPFHDLPLSVGDAAGRRDASGALGDAPRPYRRAKRVGCRERPQHLAAPAGHTTGEHDARERGEAKAVWPIHAYGGAPARPWDRGQADHLRYAALARSGDTLAFVRSPRMADGIDHSPPAGWLAASSP